MFSTTATPRTGRRLRLIFDYALPTALTLLACHTLRAIEPEIRALASPSQPAGQTMFTEVPPDQSGVGTENRYADPEMWGKRYHEFEIGPIGTGVAIGDYDGDGKPDLFVVSKTESCRLFRNLGNWKFEDVSDKAGVADSSDAARIWKQGATFVDVNNDGRLDLYVCRFDAPNLLYVNQGDGTFKEQAKSAGLDVKDASTMAVFADYDRDGWLDAYVQTNLLNNSERPSGQRDYLFHNNGDGTFTNVSDRAQISSAPSQGNSAAWWDYDNDGWLDLYVANDFAAPDLLYRNNRDGTFTNVVNEVVPHMTYSSMGSDVGDVNNDGLMDLMVADMAATSHLKDQRTMADTRARTEDPAENATAIPTYLHNTLYLNTGTGLCLEAAYLTGLSATDWTWSVRFEDLDNDGFVDLHVTNGMHREIHNTDLILRMMTAESAHERVRIARTSPVLTEPNLAYRNKGDLEFENVSTRWGLDQNGVSFGAAFGDLDGDGDLDLVYTNFEAGVTLLRNDSVNGQRLTVALRGNRSNRFGIGAKILAETASGIQLRQMALGRGYMSSSEPIVHFGLGADTLIKRLTITWPNGTVQTLENIATNRHLVITEPIESSTGVEMASAKPRETRFKDVSKTIDFSFASREEPIDEIAQQRFLPTRLNRRGPALAVGKVDATGSEYVFIGGTTLTAPRIVRIGADAPSISAEMALPATGTPVNDGPILVFDANADGVNDLLFTRGGASQPAGSSEFQPVLLISDGQGGFNGAKEDTLPSLLMSVGAVTAADFNHDGALDLFIGGRVSPGDYPSPASSALLVNHHGKFEDVTATVIPALQNIGMVTAALWSDVDGDTWPDLLLTLEWGNVKYFHNSGGAGFEDWTDKAGFAAAGTGWWTSITTSDFNGDGRPDYVVGNIGLNTPYRADAAHPTLLLRGDFKGNGTSLLIEAYHEEDTLYPSRTRRELGAALPAVLKRFPRNDTYARATLGEILGEKPLAAAERFAATELRSGVFLSRENSQYEFIPLPRIAQIAPLQGMVAGDFDGDGKVDLYAVQNSYAPNPVVGRFDGGLSQFLRGDGRGHFEPLPASETGLVVPGDAKALVATDLNADGWPDFLLTRNNNTTMAFRNQPVTGRRSLRVSLRGTGGNPDAIGSRLTARYADGSSQSFEIGAGAGYYSQSSSAAFIGSPASNPLNKIEIRWPSGKTSVHDIPATGTSLTLSEPTD